MAVSNTTQTTRLSPMLSRRKALKRTGTPELELEDTTFQEMKALCADRSVSDDDDDIASLAFTGSDSGMTDSSDERCDGANKTGTTVRRVRMLQKDGEIISGTKLSNNEPHVKVQAQCEVGKYMAGREMSPFQERMNALTVLPSTYYCIMFFLSGSWLTKTFIEDHGNRGMQDVTFDHSQCISSSLFPNLHALPPLQVLAAAIGILCHAPFSMIYHWKYAHRLPAGLPRTTHWSRRMDQAMIHFCSACMSYSTSGRFDFFLLNTLFNIDSMYRQFLKQVIPKRNQRRIGLSILFYNLPILMKDLLSFSKLGVLFALGGWLFGQYPIGGWSHSAFHVVMAFVPPIIFAFALKLPASQPQLHIAAQCAVLAEYTFAT
mmetsp:Transcript_8736/g.25923  ORF Transcript_8736/g.25923 Transcript_8736/m.25923 type:complete len:375 (-) Transcript_8736:1355-2479(-)|eukprot:CAMPEP_0172358362 /NCGR_PEP_ID=MMETSP1060-20121228/2671_1 /TAXON_ID=37318 /ORGANISM="Pseudo-nitzschia pungens, Strain cf. cingulata" /LENGTH=374 /DNA_ID=CAMNT_0013079529 /DNA_START=1354 /DNA_END=2478 /DNA_ORIENTATION=-